MTEYEKMLAGEMYHSSDPEMLKLCTQARQLTFKYNRSPNLSDKDRRAILEQLFARLGNNVLIDIPFYTDHGVHTSIGNNVIVGMNCIFIDNNKITIGNNVMIASGVQLCTATHPLRAQDRIVKNWNEDMQRNWYHSQTKEISIGSNVWIGANVIVLPGVTIGDNSTIAAGSVVNKDIPSDTLAMGVPCKPVKKL